MRIDVGTEALTIWNLVGNNGHRYIGGNKDTIIYVLFTYDYGGGHARGLEAHLSLALSVGSLRSMLR